MNQSTPTASLRDYLDVLRAYRYTVLLVVAICAGGALLYSLLQEPVYTAEASLLFREATDDVEFVGLPPVQTQTPEVRAAVGAERVNRRDVAAGVRRRLGLERDVDEVLDDFEARAEVRTNLVVIEAYDSEPERAARIANAAGSEAIELERADTRRRFDALITATAREFGRVARGDDPVVLAQRRDLQDRLIRLRTTRDFAVPAEFSQRAEPPRDRSSPLTLRNTLVGLGAGLVLGVLLALVRSALDTRLRTAREILDASQLPLVGVVRKRALGCVPFEPDGGNSGGRKGSEPVDMEMTQMLAARLEHMQTDRPIRHILVTSPMPEEGKSTLATHLAAVMALAGRRPLLLECDLRRPVLADRLALDPGPGMVDYLSGTAEPSEILRFKALPPNQEGLGISPDQASPVNADGEGARSIAVVPAGTALSRSAELIGSDRFSDFMETVGKPYDPVILDSAPLLVVADPLELIEHVDIVVLCIRANRTTHEQLAAALESLAMYSDTPVTLAVTGVHPGEEGDYGFYATAYGGSTR